MVISAQMRPGIGYIVGSYSGKFSLKDKGSITLTQINYSGFSYYIGYSLSDSLDSTTKLGETPAIAQGESYTFSLNSVDDSTLKKIKYFVVAYNNVQNIIYQIQVDYNEPAAQVRPLTPSGITENNSQPITFKWQHISVSNDKSYGYDIEYSYNQSQWNSLNSVSSVGNYSPVSTEYTASANKFDSGIVYWRVRTYNSSDVVSEWGSASFIARAKISAPTFSSVSDTPKIKIIWSSTEQVAFQVIANQYDSGTVFGTSNFYTIPYYFTDGETVNIKLRVKDKFGDWSEWSKISKTISNSTLKAIALTAETQNNSAVLNWQVEGESPYNGFFVLRDRKPIAKLESENAYTDYSSVLATEYVIMGVTSDGYYTLSNPVSVEVMPQTAIIGVVSDSITWIQLFCRRGNMPEIVTSSSEDIYYQYYSGRTLPVAYSSKFKTKNKTLNFTVYKRDADTIENMTGQTVIYKDYAGNKIIGILNNVETSSYATRPDIRMDITAINYSEVIEYD